MRALNIQQLAVVADLETFELFERKLSFRVEKVKMKEPERLSLISLVAKFKCYGATERCFERFFFSYTIPKISKEFDLLRINDNTIINIELKSNDVGEERIKKQLLQNKQYLSHLQKDMYLYTYEKDSENFYELNCNDELEEIEVSKIISELKRQQSCRSDNIDSLFKPSDFLVSPLNDTKKFLDKQYFFTSDQDEKKREIMSFFSSTEARFCGLNGGSGSGKTLLLYDIAVEYSNENNVCIIHCGKLCEGHLELNDSNDNLDIIAAKDVCKIDFSKYQLVFVDESHRFYEKQYHMLKEKILKNKIKSLFSYDEQQILSRDEMNANIIGKLKDITAFKECSLSKRFRTNPEISSFIDKLFNWKKEVSYKTFPSVNLYYANDSDEAEVIMKLLYGNDFFKTLINYTGSKRGGFFAEYFSNKNTHEVIGQEFNEVLMVINENFSYDSDGKLVATIPHPNENYILEKLLYQGLTRVREKLTLIIVNNQSVFKTLLEKTHIVGK